MSAQDTLTLQDKIAYGFGQVCENIKNYAFSYFVLFYYSQLLGLSASLTGLALFIGMLMDAVTDPLAGSISDRWQSRWGRRHPFMYASIIPMGITFFLVFAPPADLGQMGLFVWLTVFTILSRLFMTLFQIPYAAMSAELTDHYTERTSISQFRFGIGVTGIFAVFGLGFLVFFAGEKGQFDADAYPAFGASLVLVMVVTMFWAARGTHHLIPRLRASGVAEQGTTLMDLLRDTLSVLRNASFRWFFMGVLILYIMVGVDSALFLYVGSYIWEFERDQFFLLTITAAFGFLIGSVLTKWLHQRFDKKPIILIAISWWAFWQVLPIMLYLAGWLPPAGSTALLAVLVSMRLVQYIGTMQAIVTAPSMIADVADEHELNTGRRQEGIFFGGLTFSGKATSGLGKFVAGIAIDIIAFPKGADILPSDVPPDKLFWLAMTYGPIVCGFAVVAVWAASKYAINKARHDQILAELKTRKEVTGPEANLAGLQLAKGDPPAAPPKPAPKPAE